MVQYYTVPEVAKMLRVAKGTVYTLINSGKLPAVRLSERGWRIPEDALKALINN